MFTFSTGPHCVTANPETDTDIEIGKATDDTGDDLWKVIIHNDAATTMDFVIMILVDVFKRPLIIAEAIMWEAHNNGQSIIDAMPKEEAERKVRQAHFRARISGFPLTLTIEQ